MIKDCLYPEGHQNPISGSIVTAILLKEWILPIGGASAGEGLRLQPAQQACLIKYNIPFLTFNIIESLHFLHFPNFCVLNVFTFLRFHIFAI